MKKFWNYSAVNWHLSIYQHFGKHCFFVLLGCTCSCIFWVSKALFLIRYPKWKETGIMWICELHSWGCCFFCVNTEESHAQIYLAVPSFVSWWGLVCCYLQSVFIVECLLFTPIPISAMVLWHWVVVRGKPRPQPLQQCLVSKCLIDCSALWEKPPGLWVLYLF